MTSEHSKTWDHVHHLLAASEGLRKDGGRFSAQEKGRKVEKKKKEATAASSDPGEKQQSQGEGQEKEKEGVSVFSDAGEEEQQNHGESPEKEERGATASSNQEEEQKDREEGQARGKKEGASTSSEEQRRDQGKSHERNPSPSALDTLSEGLDKERLALLRNQLQAQFSFQEHQEDQSPCRHLVELVGRIVHGEGDDRTRPENRDMATEGQCPTCGQCNNTAGCSHGLLAEMEKVLQRELAALKEEVTASIESMRKEMAEELSILCEALQAYNEHRFPQATDLSPLEEVDEKDPIPTRLEEGRHVITQAGKLPDKISAEEKFKSRSVPTLHPLPISGRNQAVLRAAVTVRSGFASHLSRSNSDPVEPAQAQSTIFPLAIPKRASRKVPVKTLPPPATRTYASKGYSNKMAARTPDPHPPCDICEGRSH